MILASFWDVNGNGIDVTDFAAILAFLVALIGAFVGLFRWSRRQLRDEISDVVESHLKKWTAPIQKEANGGLSLPDVARKSDWTKAAVKAIAAAQGVDLPPDPDDR
jgi:hypothetical protein